MEHSDPRYRPLMLAVREADEKFEAAGEAGTKTWLDDYFLPSLSAQGLAIVTQADAELGAAVRRSGLIESLYETYDGELSHLTVAGEDGEDVDLTDCCDSHRGIHGAWVELRDQPAVEAFFDD